MVPHFGGLSIRSFRPHSRGTLCYIFPVDVARDKIVLSCMGIVNRARGTSRHVNKCRERKCVYYTLHTNECVDSGDTFICCYVYEGIEVTGPSTAINNAFTPGTNKALWSVWHQFNNASPKSHRSFPACMCSFILAQMNKVNTWRMTRERYAYSHGIGSTKCVHPHQKLQLVTPENHTWIWLWIGVGVWNANKSAVTRMPLGLNQSWCWPGRTQNCPQ